MESYNIPDTIIFDNPEEFSVSLRNTEPMLRHREQKSAGRARGILSSIASVAVLISALSLLLLMSGSVMMIPFTLAGAVVFAVYTLIRNKLGDTARLIITLLIVIALIAVFVIFRKYIASGLALIMNSIYDYAEEAQAYLYDRLPVGSKGDESPDLCMITAVCWTSALAGLLAAFPGERLRSLVNTLIVIVIMIIFAYFGMVPSIAGTMVLLAAYLISLNKGRINSTWPLLLVVLLLFGAIVMIDPGQNPAVSRANENIRDRFAFHSSYIQGVEDPGDLNEDTREGGITEALREFLNGGEEGSSALRYAIVISIPLLIIAAAIVLIHRRLAKKRRLTRKDIDSKDPGTAIGAMFPYAVRWLKVFGINVSEMHFSDLTSEISDTITEEYAQRYDDMLKLWQEAVYSDHRMSDDDQAKMSDFMKETIKMSKKHADWKERLKIRFSYAL